MLSKQAHGFHSFALAAPAVAGPPKLLRTIMKPAYGSQPLVRVPQESVAATRSSARLSFQPPAQVHPLFSQESMRLSVCGQFEEDWVRHPFPFLEYLVNTAPFSTYLDYLERHGQDSSTVQPPDYAPNRYKGGAAVAAGRQGGALGSSGAVPDLIGLMGNKSAHLHESIAFVATRQLPWHDTAVVD